MDFEALVRDDYADKRWILCAEVAAAATNLVTFLGDNGAGDLFLLCGGRGVGDIPDIPTYTLGTSGDTIMSGIRAFESAVVHLPDEALAALDQFDPGSDAHVLFAGFESHTEIAGRPVFAPRRPDWHAIEDKIGVLDIWREANIAVAPHQVVDASHANLADAHHALDQGSGTVWVADNRTGWHGGGEYLRWVQTPDQLATAVDFMIRNAYQVRVMPFLQGIPCSIHGFVTAHDMAVFRPVEMLTLWRADQLVYSGLATTWDPSPGDRDVMRAAAMAVGDVMRSTVSYRGPFSLDGIMAADGFRPTEINPRPSTGLGIQLGEISDIPLGALTRHLTAHPDADIDTVDLEHRILTHADRRRSSRAMFFTERQLPSEQHRVRISDRAVIADESGPIELSAGPALHGGIVFARSEPGVVAAGSSFAPVVARLAPYVEAWLGIEIGDLDYATDVRA